MEAEEIRELDDVSIHAREERSGFFVATFRPVSPETHLARGGFTIDTARGLQGRNLTEVLDWSEAHWRRNYPDTE
jgi:hypothetical protein